MYFELNFKYLFKVDNLNNCQKLVKNYITLDLLFIQI